MELIYMHLMSGLGVITILGLAWKLWKRDRDKWGPYIQRRFASSNVAMVGTWAEKSRLRFLMTFSCGWLGLTTVLLMTMYVRTALVWIIVNLVFLTVFGLNALDWEVLLTLMRMVTMLVPSLMVVYGCGLAIEKDRMIQPFRKRTPERK